MMYAHAGADAIECVCILQGKFAKKQDWVAAFGVQDDAEVCRLILDQGELQVSEGERKAQVEKCVECVCSGCMCGFECVVSDDGDAFAYLSACIAISRRSWRTSA